MRFVSTQKKSEAFLGCGVIAFLISGADRSYSAFKFDKGLLFLL